MRGDAPHGVAWRRLRDYSRQTMIARATRGALAGYNQSKKGEIGDLNAQHGSNYNIKPC